MPDPSTRKTRLRGKWRAKMAVFFVALTGLGIWGLWDATTVYPKRGYAYEQFALQEYLEQSRDIGPGLLNSSVTNPADQFARLSELAQPNPYEAAKLEWLEAVSRVRNLQQVQQRNQNNPDRRTSTRIQPDESPTLFDEPATLFANLQTELAQREQPKPLSAYDIPVQWLITFAGFLGAAWVAVSFLRAASRTYRYEPDSHTIILPGGERLSPDNVTDIDKRQWHKWYVHLKLNDGSERRLDLLRYVPLEDWVLEIERIIKQDQPAPNQPQATDQPPAEAAPGHTPPPGESDTTAD